MKFRLKSCAALVAAAGFALLPAAERAGDGLLGRADGVLREEVRGLYGDLTSAGRWREFAVGSANGEQADIRGWLSSRWEETPGRLADRFAAGVAETAAAGLRAGGWVEHLDFSFGLPLRGREGRLELNATGSLWTGTSGGDSALGWHLPLAIGGTDDGGADSAEVVGNLGIFYRRTFGDSGRAGLAGLNVFGDYQDAGLDGGFWRWSAGLEYRSAWADVFANRYFPVTGAKRRLLSGDRERLAYTAGGYDAEVRFHSPRSRWLEGFAAYELWEGEFGDGDDAGFRYGFRMSPETGGVVDGLRLEADYDDGGDGLGARFSYEWLLGGRSGSGGYGAFDAGAYLYAPVERRHGQKVRVRVRSLGTGALGARTSGEGGADTCPTGALPRVGDPDDLLLSGTQAGNYAEVCRALRMGASPNRPEGPGADWAMHYAATLTGSSAVSILILLTSRGADMDAAGDYNETPLHHAAHHGAFEAGKFLITAGADLSLKSTVPGRYFAARPVGEAAIRAAYFEEEGLPDKAEGATALVVLMLARNAECIGYHWVFYGTRATALCAGEGLSTPLSWSAAGTVYAASGYGGRAHVFPAAESAAGAVNLSLVYSLAGESGFGFSPATRGLDAEEPLRAGEYLVTVKVSADQGRLESTTLFATLTVSVLAGVSATLTVSPFAENFLNLSIAAPAGLEFARVSSSRELTDELESGGEVAWAGAPAATVFGEYHWEAQATAAWLAGTLSYSLSLEAGCASGALVGDNVSGDDTHGDFLSAAYNGRVNDVCRHLARDPGIIDIPNSAGRTALYSAVFGAHLEGRHLETADLLLLYGANPNIPHTSGKAALDLADEDGLKTMAERLRRGGGICLKNGGDFCGLRFWPRAATVTLTAGDAGAIYTITVETKTSVGGRNAAVSFAVGREGFRVEGDGNAGVVRLTRAAETSDAGELRVTVSSGTQSLTLTLMGDLFCPAPELPNGGLTQGELDNRLINAAKAGNAAAVCQWAGKGANPAVIREGGGFGYSYSWTALHWAAYNGHLDVVEYLASRGDVDVNARDNRGWTPLHHATDYGHLEVVKYLSSRGDVNARDNRGGTPLHWAARYGYASSDFLEVAKYLLSREDVDANVRDNDGRTPLHWAVDALSPIGSVNEVKYLASHEDVDVNIRDNRGRAPLDDVSNGYFANIAATTLRASGAVCYVSTSERCGLIMRPFHSTVTVDVGHSGAVHTVTATTHSEAAAVYSVVYGEGFSVDGDDGELHASAGTLVEGLVATVSIMATTEGGTQSVTVEVVVEVSSSSALSDAGTQWSPGDFGALMDSVAATDTARLKTHSLRRFSVGLDKSNRFLFGESRNPFPG